MDTDVLTYPQTKSSFPVMHKYHADGSVIASLHYEFVMKNLGSLNYCIGISAHRSSASLFLSQSTYAAKNLERAHMKKCNPCRTLVDTYFKLGTDGDPVSDPTLYRIELS
ncbi:ribonuclease H-like domain-containing protein [Tanacetum coccineum]